MPPSLAGRADAVVASVPLLLDTMVLNNFIKVGRLLLLRPLFPASLRVATQVLAELKAGASTGLSGRG